MVSFDDYFSKCPDPMVVLLASSKIVISFNDAARNRFDLSKDSIFFGDLLLNWSNQSADIVHGDLCYCTGHEDDQMEIYVASVTALGSDSLVVSLTAVTDIMKKSSSKPENPIQYDVQTLFKCHTDPIIIANGSGKILSANPSAKNTILFEESDLVGQNVLDVLNCESMDVFINFGRDDEITIRKRDGGEFQAEIYYSRCVDDHIIRMRDITEKKIAEKNMRETQARIIQVEVRSY